MNEEIVRILKMIEEGKISADQAKILIETLNEAPTEIIPYTQKSSYEDKFLKLNVLSAQGDKVNVKLPVQVIKEVLKVTGKLPINMNGLQDFESEHLINTILECLDQEVMGEILNVSSAQGDTVKLVIE